jgi:hypothetical protein
VEATFRGEVALDNVGGKVAYCKALTWRLIGSGMEASLGSYGVGLCRHHHGGRLWWPSIAMAVRWPSGPLTEVAVSCAWRCRCGGGGEPHVEVPAWGGEP